MAGSVLVRVVQGILRHVLGEQHLLLCDITLDGASEDRVPDLVRAVGEGGEEAARKLVLALRPGLEELETPLDRRFCRFAPHEGRQSSNEFGKSQALERSAVECAKRE